MTEEVAAKPGPTRKWYENEKLGPALWVSTAAVSLVWYCWRKNPALGFEVWIDWIHQISVFEWFHRSLFENAGELVSATYYFPVKGVLATSEIAFLPGLVYACLREPGSGRFLAWNLIFYN